MLEEAAGISHFRYRRADATRRLEQAEENLVRLRDILTELEGRVRHSKRRAKRRRSSWFSQKELEIGTWAQDDAALREGLERQEINLSRPPPTMSGGSASLREYRSDRGRVMSTGKSDDHCRSRSCAQRRTSDEEQATAVDGRNNRQRNDLSVTPAKR